MFTFSLFSPPSSPAQATFALWGEKLYQGAELFFARVKLNCLRYPDGRMSKKQGFLVVTCLI